MATQTDHLDSLRQQADQIKEDIKQKRKECRDTTMQQVSTYFPKRKEHTQTSGSASFLLKHVF